MKHFLTAIVMISLTISSACTKASVSETPAQRLAQRLLSIENQGKVAFGHHDDTSYGHAWKYEANRSDVRDVCGDYPALMSWDLGLIEWNTEKQLDGVPFDFIRQEVAKQDARGGINAFSWHLRNPITKGDSWDCEGGNVVAQCLTEGSALNDTICAWIGRAADFIGSLRNKDGQRIAVIFRPWHEHTGSWFWWGYDHCSADDYKALWKLTRRIFDQKGIDNVLWAYSPDKDHFTGIKSYLERYPGDDYVDIMGADVYHFGGQEGLDTYLQNVKNMLGAATLAAKEHHKLAAFTETGSEGIPMPNWWHEVLLPILKQYPVCYVTVWRNACDKPTHFYAPYKGHTSEESFKAFHADSATLFCTEINQIK